MKKLSIYLILALAALFAGAATVQAADLDSLLKQVKQAKAEEARLNKQREAEFLKNKARQAELLAAARAKLAAEKARGEKLKAQFDENEQKLAEAEETLERRQGNLGELFGVVRQVAGDVAGVLDASLVSSQYPGRSDKLVKMSNDKKLPSIPELEELWYQMQHEMTESGKVVRYQDSVVAVDGTESKQEVVRVGVFNSVTNGKFLRYLPETDQLIILPRQPAKRFTQLAENLQKATSGIVPMAVDPSRGSILNLLVQAPDLRERVAQGKEVGYIIIGLAIFGFLLAIYRFMALGITSMKVRSQLKHADQPKKNNPLGRVLLSWYDNQDADLETLERKVDEAVVKEVPKLQRGLSILKILAVIAPLLGLLGTVTGMIQTFQSITLFGTGDPKLMAGGISQALITTVLGLMAAIPLTFLHALVSARSKALVQVLEEQSAGIIARHAEKLSRKA
ncbi:MotA/TolQ/ExbB proton channel family protein [Thiolapillus brandeum]|uniref:Biopolymer transport protein ExbB n=1 Tax=Thiolapillus brandeum TaxID=1076588 RepID=A0A7U6JFI5_9GAMM|nr:MotA/TolQ/ExbB proton channel family protein [Thiolapillus brandeum]BAO43014.1 biopolymer transport protein ExbB [Thiolapillus brandeum]